MDIRPLSPDYAVSEQIVPDDMPAIVAAGYKSILCNRPNDEIPASICCDTMRTATEAAGLKFADNPFNHMQFGEDVIARQADLVENLPRPVLAYCASGTRCSIVWAFMQAGTRPVADILADARGQGYALDHLAGALEQFATTR